GNKDKIVDLTERLKKAEEENKWGSAELKCLGFRVPSRRSIPFLTCSLEDANSEILDSKSKGNAKYTGYYPGGMDRTVVSSNGWNMGRSSSIWRQVDQGVTISACGGPAYGGGPHITNATFWDNRILLRYLFRGRDLGECFLFSTYYVNWSTSLLGDPLLHPDLSKTILDDTPPKVAKKEDIRIKLEPAMGRYTGTMTIPVVSTASNPEVAKLKVYYSKEGEDIEQGSHWPIYSTRPYVILRNLEPDTTYYYRPILTDPYGNSSDLTGVLGQLSFHTPPRGDRKISVHKVKRWGKGWIIDFWGLRKLGEHATIEVEFVAGENGLMPSIDSKNFSVKMNKGQKGKIRVTMQVGGPPQSWHRKSPLQKGEKATLILRWRRFPLTREVLLQAKNGREFTLVADVRTPWEENRLTGPIKIAASHEVKILSGKILNDSLPASAEACGITVPPIDEVAWRQANK
ncbi:MAG: fibronectin type III domain-containing protein, partial [Deltaproteobacteria bacterium]|nr:fibronectin type III domain-containing protein [Deltaproteobacteria bacterium]MBW2341903.1 fibronectin type III domain-containing protein [Deltaproteobacteria bacterium]